MTDGVTSAAKERLALAQAHHQDVCLKLSQHGVNRRGWARRGVGGAGGGVGVGGAGGWSAANANGADGSAGQNPRNHPRG